MEKLSWIIWVGPSNHTKEAGMAVRLDDATLLALKMKGSQATECS